MRVRSPFRILHRIFWKKGFVEAQLIVTRRCNLSCGYCHEFDNVSKAVSLPALKTRIDALHRLGVGQIALLGGEPLLHPQIDEVVRHAARDAQVSMTTNGFLLTKELVERLNAAHLTHMQVSIDTLNPTSDLYIQKSLKSVRRRIALLKEHAAFSVHANLVLCEESKREFHSMIAELRSLDVPVTVNLLHDDRGRILIGGEEYRDLWDYHYRNSVAITDIEYPYGRALLEGEAPSWHCRAGSRHIYVDEFGSAQYCHAQRGRLDKPIVEYTREDMREQGEKRKGCEKGCCVFCVYRASQVDNDLLGVARSLLRSARKGALHIPLGSRGELTPAHGDAEGGW